MFEDALKTARNLHRLTLGVAVAALVFALSLEKPALESSWVEGLRGLKRVPFLEYREYALEQAAAAVWAEHGSVAGQLDAIQTESLVFGVDAIQARLAAPLHVGRLLVEDLVFTDDDQAKLSGIEGALSLESVDRPVQVLFPKDTSLVAGIARFLRSRGSTGARIDGLRVGFEDPSFVTESFLPEDGAYIPVYFEVRQAGGGGAPVFTADVECRVVELGPETSFRAWLSRQAEAKELISDVDGILTLFPDLRPFPEGWGERTVGELLVAMETSLRDSRPESRTISIVTLQVPGSLVLLAVPLSLVALMLYLRAHVHHLIGVAQADADDVEVRRALRRFSWLPLRKTSDAALELWITVRLLPPIACAVLLWRVWGFGTPSIWSFGAIAIGIIVTGLVGHLLARDFETLRRRASSILLP